MNLQQYVEMMVENCDDWRNHTQDPRTQSRVRLQVVAEDIYQMLHDGFDHQGVELGSEDLEMFADEVSSIANTLLRRYSIDYVPSETIEDD